MKAAVLTSPAPISSSPLQIEEVPTPDPQPGHVLLRVLACGVCRTDLHIVEGELPPRKPRVILGHQIVGEVVAGDFDSARESVGAGQGRAISLGSRVGVSWLGGTDGTCSYCR